MGNSICISVEGVGYIDEDKAMAKWREYKSQAAGLDATITGHRNSILECERQLAEIDKLAEPYRRALIRRLGGGA